jgi:predicted ATPase
VRLFVERAAQVRPGFTATPHVVHAVADLCRRLDGLPLAIELAAARTRVLTVEQIAERLDARFDLLTGGAALPARHQTLLAAMDWSHDLLSNRERALFRRLAIFERGWTLDEAEAACAGDDLPRTQILDLLTQLVDKSLVVADTDPAGPTHFRMLETIREYAWGELVAAGEVEATQRAKEAS